VNSQLQFDHSKILKQFAQLETDDDTSSDVARVFLPLPTHQLALRPDAVIVLGGRGAGKTALFRLIKELGSEVGAFLQDPVIPSARWVDAYADGIDHPAPSVLDELVAQVGAARDTALRAFWATDLLAQLERGNVEGASLPEAIRQAWLGHERDPARWVDVAERNIGSVMAGLDRVEGALASKKYLVFASYDHLDRLGILATNRTHRQRLVRTLLALWLSNASRYRHLRGKIFLRPDLFDEAQDSFPDASKLRPRAVTLTWDVPSLYRLVIRHLANRGPYAKETRAWLEGIGIKLYEHPADREWGLLPNEMGGEKQKAFAVALAGNTMGAGTNKGFTHRWIPARLRDAGGSIVPRSFLRLLSHAAKSAMRDEIPRQGPLMSPTHLVGALQATSKDRAAELNDEYPFVRRLEGLRGQNLLLKRSIVIRRLSAPTSPEDGFGEDGQAVFDEMRRIGVLELRPDDRIDVPDIYRYGYDIKRKGGAKAPR
jgi:hypothetical protein